MIMWIFIVILAWVIGALIAYFCVFAKSDNSMFEKIWLSIFWPLLLPLAFIHWIHNWK